MRSAPRVSSATADIPSASREPARCEDTAALLTIHLGTLDRYAVLRDGIQTALELQATVLLDGLPIVSYQFGMSYDAIAWDESQSGILGLITDK